MKVGIVGCGQAGEFHFNAWRSIGIPIAAVCDANKDTAMQAAEKWKIPLYYTELSKMLQSENLFAISICSPPQFHADQAIEALRSDCHVVVEKPFTVTTKEADKVMNVLQGSSPKLTVIHNQLFEPSILHAMKQIKTGAIGQVIGMNVGLLHSKDERMAANKNHWCHKLPGGRFGEILPHPVYLLQAVLGNLEVKSVFVDKLADCPWMPFDDLRVVLEADGKFGTIHTSFNVSGSNRVNVYADIYGTNGTLHAGIYPISSLIAAKPGRGFWLGENIIYQVKIGLTYIGMLLKRRKIWGFSPSHALIIKSSVKSILDNEELPVTPEMGYEHVRIVEEICKQIERAA
jgi:predicted dehydrogenase